MKYRDVEYVCKSCNRSFYVQTGKGYFDSPLSVKCVCGADAARAPYRLGIISNTTFVAGRGTLLDQHGGDEAVVRQRVELARRHGYEPSYNDIYMPTLARFPGDPRAFLKPGDAIGQARKVEQSLRRRKPRQVRAAPDLLREKVMLLQAEKPGVESKRLKSEALERFFGGTTGD